LHAISLKKDTSVLMIAWILTKGDCVFNFGIDVDTLFETIELGTPFMTTGCLGPNGRVACNRPFGNCLPDDKQWNYPYPPTKTRLASSRSILFRIDSGKKPLTYRSGNRPYICMFTTGAVSSVGRAADF
jgi:hypothetical protein